MKPEITLIQLKDLFVKGFGPSWFELEDETLFHSLGIIPGDLITQKTHILRVLDQHPGRFIDDVLFFLHAVEIINNHLADQDTFPLPTSLEMAYALLVFKHLYPAASKFDNSDITEAVAYILKEEGYSGSVEPFISFGVSHLTEEVDTELTNNRQKAVIEYCSHMATV